MDTDIELDGYLNDVFIPFLKKKIIAAKSADADLSDVGPIGLIRICIILASNDIYLTNKLKKAYRALKELGL